MLFYCEYSLLPGTSREKLQERVLEMHHAGANHQDRIEGSFSTLDGDTGFIIVDFDTASDLQEALEPYRDVLKFAIVPMREINYEQQIDAMQRKHRHLRLAT